MKTYTVFDNVSVGSGGSPTQSVSIENVGQDLNYAIAIKGGIASADVAVDVEIPKDSEVYNTKLKGVNTLNGIDLSDGGEFRNLEHTPELSSMRSATDIHVTVTNNDAASENVTVKIIQFGNE